MSRSRKKPILKDKTNHKWYNRIFRRVNKQRINSGKDPKLMNELICQYDICDWKITTFGGDRWFKIINIEKAKRK